MIKDYLMRLVSLARSSFWQHSYSWILMKHYLFLLVEYAEALLVATQILLGKPIVDYGRSTLLLTHT